MSNRNLGDHSFVSLLKYPANCTRYPKDDSFSAENVIIQQPHRFGDYLSKEKIGDKTMTSALEEQPFKNRDDIRAEIKRCSVFASYCMVFCIIFALIGVIGDASNTTLGLASMSWFLLAIIAALFGIYPQMHSIAARHLLYVDETRKEQ